MPYSYDRYETRRRQTTGSSSRKTALGHWLPLAITVTVATAGIAAWIWNERRKDEGEDERPPGPPPSGYGSQPQGPDYGPPNGVSDKPLGGYGSSPGKFPDALSSGFGSMPPGQPTYAGVSENREMEEEGLVSRMSGALRRTPSPQQIIDGASRRVAAGVAAAGAAVGGALASIREEERRDYEDHSRWSEEADPQNGSSRKGPELRDAEAVESARQTQTDIKPSRKKKTVAIVVSAETDYDHEEDAGYHQEHASILSHLPEHIGEDTRVFVLIYDPNLKQHPLSSSSPNGPNTQSVASSFSNIGHQDAQSRNEGSPSPSTTPRSKTFNKLYTQAQAIAEKDTMIMPFNTATGFVHMLRHLGVETVYLQALLAGSHGENIDPVMNWVGQIVLIVGDESGHGGLVDSEDEHWEDTRNRWWLDDSRIGLGKGIEVVEGLRIGEDFKRRIGGHE